MICVLHTSLKNRTSTQLMSHCCICKLQLYRIYTNESIDINPKMYYLCRGSTAAPKRGRFDKSTS